MKKIKLGEILEVRRGTSLSGNFYSEQGKFIRLTLGNFDYPHGGFKENTAKKDIFFIGSVNPEFILKAGDIITPLTEQVSGLLGETAFIPESNKYIQSGDIGLVIPDENKLDKKFAYYLVSSPMVRKQLDAVAQQTKIRHTSPAAIKNCETLIPPLAEQKKIGTFLYLLDRKISLNKKINENLESQLNLFYEKLFCKENDFIELGKVVETKSGGTPSRKNNSFYENANICWVKSKELDGKYIVDTEEKITDEAVKNSSAKILPPNSVLIAMYGATVGEYGIIEKSMTCNQAICALIGNRIYPYTYLYQVAKKSKGYFSKISIGSAQQNINQETIKKLLIHKNIDKISEFHTFAEPIHKLLKNLEKENKMLSALRDWILPMLMNGQVTIKD